MARPKKVSSDQILDAVERVVVKLGAARLSIDAVAKEAGISKSRVVLDYKSKKAMLEALIDRELQQESARIESLLESCADTPHPQLFARLKLAEQAPDDTDRAVVMAITSATMSESSLRRKMVDWVNQDLRALDSCAKPEIARMFFFAVIGFNCHEWFGMAKWSEQERLSYLDLIRKMYVSCSESGAPTPLNPHKG